MATSNIDTQFTVRNNTEGLTFNKTQSYLANEQETILTVLEVTSTAALLSFGNVNTPRYITIAHRGTAESVLVSFDNVSYDQEVLPEDNLTIRLRNSDKQEVQTAQTVADVAGSLNTTYFTLEGITGTWAVWFDVDDSGSTEPAHGATNSVKIIGVVTGDTAAAVAATLAAELEADSAFSLDFTSTYDATVDDDLVTIRDNNTGNRTNIAAGTSGFTVATTQAGAAIRSVYLKTTSGNIPALVGVFPN